VEEDIFSCPTLFGHTNFRFNHQGEKKVDNSGGCCRIGGMSEGKERIVAEHPNVWVVRIVEGRGLKVAEKTLYWWSVHLEQFLKFCRSAGAEYFGEAVEEGWRIKVWEDAEEGE